MKYPTKSLCFLVFFQEVHAFNVGIGQEFKPSSRISIANAPSSLKTAAVELLTRESNPSARISIANPPASLKEAVAEPLAREGSWNAYLDAEETGLIYYFNHITGEASWSKPSTSFPEVQVDTNILYNAKELRKSYLKEYRSKQLHSTLIDDIHRYGTNIANEFSKKIEETEEILQRSKINMKSSARVPIASREHFGIFSKPDENIFKNLVKSITTTFTNGKSMPFFNKKKNSLEETNENKQTGHATNADNVYNDFGEQLEMTKTFVSGFLSGGIAVAPFVAFQDIVLQLSLSSQAIEKFYLDTSICSIECALFSLILRLCIRDGQKDDDLFKSLIVSVSTFTNLSSQLSSSQMLISGIENVAMFSAVTAAYDFGCKKGIISRLN